VERLICSLEKVGEGGRKTFESEEVRADKMSERGKVEK